MNKPRTIEGRWWIHGDKKPPRFGVLTSDPETGLTLSVKIPKAGDSEKAWVKAFKSFNKAQQVPPVIHGSDENNNPITLFGCGYRSHSVASGLHRYEIRSLRAATNIHASSWSDPLFRSAVVRFSLLSQCLGRFPPSQNEAGKLFCFKIEGINLIEAQIFPNLRIKVEETVMPHFKDFQSIIQMEHRVWFTFSAAVGAETAFQRASEFLRLLSLLTGRRVFIDGLSVFTGDPFIPSPDHPSKECELLMRNDGVTSANRDTHASRMMVPFEQIKHNASAIVTKWFECHQQLEPVLDLYFGARANRFLSYQSQFLFLAQALEVFHARSAGFTAAESPKVAHKARIRAIVASAPLAHRQWLQDKLAFSNQKTLAQRISDLLKAYPEEGKAVTAHIPDFATKVRHARNYYTHYGEELYNSGKVPKRLELIRITYALDAFLQICLLKELGIDGEPIKKLIGNASPKLFDLHDVPKPQAKRYRDRPRPTKKRTPS